MEIPMQIEKWENFGKKIAMLFVKRILDKNANA